MTPPRGVGDAAPYNDLARLLIAANGHGGLGQAALHPPFPQSVGRGLDPSAASRFPISSKKTAGSHARAPLPFLLLQCSYFPASSTASAAFST